MPTGFLIAAAETSFLAYLHYLTDVAGVVAGRYGSGIDGVFQTLRLHPPVRALSPAVPDASTLTVVSAELTAAWDALAIIDNAIDPDVYDRQSNAVVPAAAVRAVAAAARGLAAVRGDEFGNGDDEALGYLGDLAADELLPYPWSAFCVGCPQVGSAHWGGSVLAGDPVSIFQRPSAQTSDARLAMLLRTTRQRILERVFAVERQSDVKPGRSRRNLSAAAKEAIAAAVAPTTVFDVVDRVHRRAESDDGFAFVEGAYDDEEARQFGEALAIVADASVAAIEGVIATLIGWDVFGDLAASAARRGPRPSAARRRVSAAAAST